MEMSSLLCIAKLLLTTRHAKIEYNLQLLQDGVGSYIRAYIQKEIDEIPDSVSKMVIEVLKELKQQGCPPNDVICSATISVMRQGKFSEISDLRVASGLGGIMSILEFDNNVGKHQCALFLDLHLSNVHHSWRSTKSIKEIYEHYMQKEIDEKPEPVTSKTRGADVLLHWL
ncbi:hypothetical protein Ddye_031794 [Dipteronia dyeriana]|uniref:Uncharacterized protein n=1 Tax=Dipteronia dyeriana TaxID=168575 RepID=A0AAD9TJM6_9ROSI|nr:hypothetical protein Ddye_031794 [Dipteronia dyeriana]